MNAALILVMLAQAAPVAPQAPAPAASVAAPAPTPAPTPWSGPIVVVETSLGDVKIGLNRDKAPLSVDNFLKYARAGHYAGTIFHRVIPNFMIQGGGLDPAMTEKPTRPPIRNEASNGLRNSRGSVAMARTNDPNSAAAQFYVNLKDNHSLDFGIRGAGYAVFGQVLEGMDVVERIAGVPTTARGYMEDVPVTPVVIKGVRELNATPAPKAAPRPPKRPAAKPSPKPEASGRP